MAENFEIKKTNFLLILENDISRPGIFVNWIYFLNEGFVCHFALTYSVQLNFGLLPLPEEPIKETFLASSLNCRVDTSQ